jgi:tungstate transport system substrate-binding protein
MRRLASPLCAAIVMLCACSTPPLSTRLDIATTTSVVNSGLLSHLTALCESETGIAVRAHAAGSGRALAMLEDGVVDLVISHAPRIEGRLLQRHPEWGYRKIAVNRFLIVGPADDPAAIMQADDATSAFARLATSAAAFVSRGDESGTHERERELWRLAGATPPRDRLLVSGGGMGATLRQADAADAYTLTDDATFMQLRAQLQLRALFSRDPMLVNPYAVLYRRDTPAAAALAEWLIGGNGREATALFAIDGTQVFQVWPRGCPNGQPADAFCEH